MFLKASLENVLGFWLGFFPHEVKQCNFCDIQLSHQVWEKHSPAWEEVNT